MVSMDCSARWSPPVRAASDRSVAPSVHHSTPVVIASSSNGARTTRQTIGISEKRGMPRCLFAALLVHADIDDVVAALYFPDVALLRLDLVADRVDPAVLDPAFVLLGGQPENLLHQELAVGILDIDDDLAHAVGPGRIDDPGAFVVDDIDVDFAVFELAFLVEGGTGLVNTFVCHEHGGLVCQCLDLIGRGLAIRSKGSTG